VDVTYRWFGIPHKQFQILDDVQVIASDLYQLAELYGRLELFPIANKLYPDCLWGHLAWASAFLRANQWGKARQIVNGDLTIQSDRWEIHSLRGIFAATEGKLEIAEAQFRKGLQLCGDSAENHFNLAEILKTLRRYDEAVFEYQRCLKSRKAEYLRESVEQKIQEIDAILK
jgi:tetratricopeptide (TPR) repeat protein